MKCYVPLYLPNQIIGFKAGDKFIVTTIEYCEFNPDNGYSYYLKGFMNSFKEDKLIKIPQGAYFAFEI